jgi:hypothetical protein
MATDTRQAVTFRLTTDRYEWMRRQAYEQRISMQRIIDEAIDLLMCTPDWGLTMDEDLPDTAPYPKTG